MSHFDQVKRDPWMTEQHYKTSTAAKEAEFADGDISDLLTSPLRDARHNKGLSWDHAYMALELAIQRYSGGEPLELVDTYVDYAFIQFQRHFDAYPTADAQLRPWVRDEYQYILWLLALAVLFGYPQRVKSLGRAWAPRLALAGTYDDTWKTQRWPGLPHDFDFAYWNGAPADQQIEFAPPNLRIELFNLTDPRLTPDGQLGVELPGHRPFVLLRLANGALLPLPMLTDTLRIDTEAMTLVLTHRISLPNTFDIHVLEARFETDPTAPLLKRTPQQVH